MFRKDWANAAQINFLPLHQFLPHYVTTGLSYSSPSNWTIKTSSYLMLSSTHFTCFETRYRLAVAELLEEAVR